MRGSESAANHPGALPVWEEPPLAYPHDLPTPPGARLIGRTWQQNNECADGSAGCYSHIGPDKVAREGKGNQDFAFALMRQDRRGDPWMLCGVADGLTHSAWQCRSAQHAVSAFLSTIEEFLATEADPLAAATSDSGKARLADLFTAEALARLQRDLSTFEAAQQIAPESQNPDFFRRYFYESDGCAARRRQKWFLTTLLAVALGPRGAIALLVGDGFLRIDRCKGSGWLRQVVELPSETGNRKARGPSQVISLSLNAESVRQCILSYPSEGATEMAMLVSSDGIVKTRETQLETVVLTSSEHCREYLLRLIHRSSPVAYPDNMSVAYCTRKMSS